MDSQKSNRKENGKLSFSEWKCGSCGKLLAMQHGAKVHIVKHKELYVTIAGKDYEITVKCTKCGLDNTHTVHSMNFSQFVEEQKDGSS